MFTTILLDLNALSDLFRDSDKITTEGRKVLINRLRRETANGSLIVLATEALFDEMAGLHRSDLWLYHKIRRELCRLSRGRVLRPLHERCPAEIRAGGPLTQSYRFLSKDQSKLAWEVLQSGQGLAAGSREVQRVKNGFERADKSTRLKLQEHARIHSQSNPREIDDALEAWKRDLRSIACDCCLAFIKEWEAKSGKELQGPTPDPAQVPSLWNFYAIRLADIYRINKGTPKSAGKISGSTAYDFKHYADAAYADLFVTSDDILLRTIALLPGNHLRTISLRKFAKEICNRFDPSGSSAECM